MDSMVMLSRYEKMLLLHQKVMHHNNSECIILNTETEARVS